MNDPLSDESLIEAYRQGETEALNTLFKRYLEPLRFFLLKHTWFKDDNHLDDILQEIFKIAFIRIKNKEFNPEGEGSFKRYLYKIASIELKKQDIKHADQPMTLSQRFPLVSPLRAVDEIVVLPPAAPDYDRRYKKLVKALKYLNGEEIRLLILVNRKVPYKDIIKHPLFSKYSLAYLKLKIHNIRQKVELFNQEVNDEEDENGEKQNTND
jgi:DNA-directed RNA polymerase specialized sigma24 family protein